MGIFERLFSSTKDDTTVRVRQDREDTDKRVGDKYEHKSDGTHTHSSYSQNVSSGSYREYHGGEKSSDRSNNK